MSKARIDEIKKALVAYLAGSSPANSGHWQVRRVTSRDLGKDNAIIVRPPAVLVWYPGEGGHYKPIGRAAGAGGTRYDVWERFLLYAVAPFKATEEKQEDLADLMIEDLKTLCAGAKLTLASGVETYLWLVGPAEFTGFTEDLAVVYALPVDVHGTWDNV